jgi:T-complex protein 1 subunit theta
LEAEAKKLTGLDQYSYSRYAKAFEIFPRILAENAGINANEFVPKMISANETEPKGLNILNGEIESISTLQIHDHRKTKEWAIRLASEAAITILRIDQIIIAKPAGGPKMQQNKNWDEDA